MSSGLRIRRKRKNNAAVQYLHTYGNLPRSFPSDAWHVTRKNPFQIGFADGIFAFKPMFSYGQRSKCADLLNSYSCLHISLGKGLQLVISALFDHLLICQAGADPKTDKTCF